MQSQVSLGDLEIEPKITFGVSVGGSATSIMPKWQDVKTDGSANARSQTFKMLKTFLRQIFFLLNLFFGLQQLQLK